jgi:hypothetical protein
LDLSSQFANSFTGKSFLLIIPFSSNTSLFISVIHLEAKFSRSSKDTMLYFFLNTALEKPFNLGILLKSGVCPHSNQAGTQPPDLAFCPLHHFPEKEPFPEESHLPSLLLVFLAQAVALILFKFNDISFFN